MVDELELKKELELGPEWAQERDLQLASKMVFEMEAMMGAGLVNPSAKQLGDL